MILYDGTKWFYPLTRYAKLFQKSYNIKEQAKILSLLLIYSIACTLFFEYYTTGKKLIDPLYFSLVGVVLSLMLVFRLNTAYDRWYEGRKQWGALVNTSRVIALVIDSILPEDNADDRKKAAMIVSAFPYLLKCHLRGETSEHWPAVVSDLKRDIQHKLPKHGPIAGAKLLQIFATKICDQYNAPLEKRIALQDNIKDLLNITGACERILKTPIPFSHSFFIKMFTLLYVTAIPFGIFHFFGWYTILGTLAIGFALIGIEIISESIEEPFGLHANDLPLTQLSSNILHSVYDTLAVEMAEHLPDDQEDEWIIY
tara:strand:+ start:15506 stop:16444 length:939 start_codon:yes stop_codon:yes gene_type:complete